MRIRQVVLTGAQQRGCLVNRVASLTRAKQSFLLINQLPLYAFSKGNSYDDDGDKYDKYEGKRSNLFGGDAYLKDVRRRMMREYSEDDRWEADESARRAKSRVGE